MSSPDIDICPDCGEHTDFEDDGTSACCGSPPYSTDPDIDLER